MTDFSEPVSLTQNADPYAISDAWATHKDFKKPFDYTLKDSGQTVLLRRLDMPDLLSLGVANEVDFMTKALVSAPPASGGQTPKEQVSDLVKLGNNFDKMKTLIDKVTVAGVIRPKLYHPPEHENARQAGLLYVDQLPWDDRQELFSVIFDSGAVSDFRQESNDDVGDVANVQDVQLPADSDMADTSVYT